MDIGRIQIVPRLRTSWEAIDLGFTLARSWYKPLFLTWAIPCFALFLSLTIVFFLLDWELWIPALVVWWLKPLWDSGPLLMGSRALFGEKIPVGTAIRENWNFLKPDWFSWLTWRRLSPSRSMVLSVTGLERLKGKQRSQRVALLTQRSGSNALWLTLTCVFMEGALLLATYALVMLFLPESLDFSIWDFNDEISTTATLIENLMTVCVYALVAPFYTMAGFALYINRRIELEAWDIEIQFRNLVAHQQTRSNTFGQTAAQLLVGLLLGTLLFVAAPTPVQAADYVMPNTVSQQQAKDRITSIMEDDAFHDWKTTSGWRKKEQREQEPQKEEFLPKWLINVLEWIWDHIIVGGADFRSGLAFVLEVLIWTTGAGLLIWLVYHYRQGIRSILTTLPPITQEQTVEVPEVLFGLDVRQESLPDDVPSEAAALWHKGEIRAAVGLLYRATLSELIHRHQFEFHPGHTERECAALVNQKTSDSQQPLNNFVQNLTKQWQLLAYAHRPPPHTTFEQLCCNWREVFPA